MNAPQHNAELNYEIMLDGEAVDAGLVALSVTSRINKIPRARLELNYRQMDTEGATERNYTLQGASTFEAEKPAKQANFLPGKRIRINLGRGHSTEEVFTGYITKQQIVAKNNGSLMLYIDCKHAANKMTLAKRTRFLHHDANNGGSANSKIDKVDDDTMLKHIVEEGDYKLRLNIKDDALEQFDHENMLQYNCSDWDFLMMRAEATGRVCQVQGDTIQLLRPELQPTASFEIELGENLLEYEAEYDETRLAEKVQLASWEIDNQGLQMAAEINASNNSEANEIQDDIYLNYGGDLDTKEARAWVKNQLMRQERGKILGTAKILGTTQIKPADTITIKGFNSVWDRDAFVAGVKHVVRAGAWYVYVQCGLNSQSHAETFNLGKTTRSTLVPTTHGLLYGKVVGYKESEEGHELLEIEIPTANEKHQSQSIYARLATFSAGENGGAVFRPYPDDEVVIGFIDNDPRFPIVLGALYNSKKPPYDLSNDKQVEVGFSINKWKISIHEEDKKMTIASPNGQHICLDDTDSDKNILLAFNDSNSIKITEQGIDIKASKLTLNGEQGVEIGGAKIEAKADASVKLEGGQIDLEGKATATLKGQITQIN